MNKIEFDILYEFKQNRTLDTKAVAEKYYKSVDVIQKAIDSLTSMGYIRSRQITESGSLKLEEYRVDSAIILAAGISSRFVPLSYELPKGLLRVRDEVLIERQIEQLHEAGVKEIIIVVGHMKEKFEYLAKKYSVILVEVKDYMGRNNHASIYAARNYLKNSIVSSSDLYFRENIFQAYAYDSYYTTIYKEDNKEERGIVTDINDKIIETFYDENSRDIWVTFGHAFFTERFSNAIIRIIEEEYNYPDTYNKFWADIQDNHLAELYMYVRRCAPNVINEFDSLEELRLFDDNYQNHSGSQIMKDISFTLEAEEKNLTNIKLVPPFASNTFKFDFYNDTYLCRVDGNADSTVVSVDGIKYCLCRELSYKNLVLYKRQNNLG